MAEKWNEKEAERLDYLPQESAPTEEETVIELATAISPELSRNSENVTPPPRPGGPGQNTGP